MPNVSRSGAECLIAMARRVVRVMALSASHGRKRLLFAAMDMSQWGKHVDFISLGVR
jgi:hypothetical protein